jgi:hypothetical protein
MSTGCLRCGSQPTHFGIDFPTSGALSRYIPHAQRSGMHPRLCSRVAVEHQMLCRGIVGVGSTNSRVLKSQACRIRAGVVQSYSSGDERWWGRRGCCIRGRQSRCWCGSACRWPYDEFGVFAGRTAEGTVWGLERQYGSRSIMTCSRIFLCFADRLVVCRFVALVSADVGLVARRVYIQESFRNGCQKHEDRIKGVRCIGYGEVVHYILAKPGAIGTF